LNIDETIIIEIFWIDDRRINVGENLELIGATNVVAVTRGAVIMLTGLVSEKGGVYPLQGAGVDADSTFYDLRKLILSIL
jgi:hypothetical protein